MHPFGLSRFFRPVPTFSGEAHEPEMCFVGHEPLRIFARVQLDNKMEEPQVDLVPGTEHLEAKAASLPARPAVEVGLTAIPAGPEDLHMTQDELMGIGARRRLDKNSEVTQSDLELQTSGLNNSRYFSRRKVRLHLHHRRRGKTNGPGESHALLIQTCNSSFSPLQKLHH